MHQLTILPQKTHDPLLLTIPSQKVAIVLYVLGILAVVAGCSTFLQQGMYAHFGVTGGTLFIAGGGIVGLVAIVKGRKPEPLAEYTLVNPAFSGEYRTHNSIHFERLHAVSEAVLLPAKWNAHALAYSIEPCPGEGKDAPAWQKTAFRLGSFVLWIITVPIAIISAILGFSLRACEQHDRSVFSGIISIDVPGKKPEQLDFTYGPGILRVDTYNVGFVPATMNIVGDQRPALIRAGEIADHYLGLSDDVAPDVIMFQETFNEDASKRLMERMKIKYPYIIHNVCPSGSGFNSGAAVVSKYPIKSLQFRPLEKMLGLEKMAPRGIFRIELEAANGSPVFLYNIHTQSLIGKERAESRDWQIEELAYVMDQDHRQHPAAFQAAMGDLNTSDITPWGEKNGPGQFEHPAMKKLNAKFIDLGDARHGFAVGHETWWHGPFANRGWILGLKMRFERWWHGVSDPTVADPGPTNWGTTAFKVADAKTTARFDYVLIPRSNPKLTGQATARRFAAPGAQSAPSDHVAVKAVLMLPPDQQPRRN